MQLIPSHIPAMMIVCHCDSPLKRIDGVAGSGSIRFQQSIHYKSDQSGFAAAVSAVDYAQARNICQPDVMQDTDAVDGDIVQSHGKNPFVPAILNRRRPRCFGRHSSMNSVSEVRPHGQENGSPERTPPGPFRVG